MPREWPPVSVWMLTAIITVPPFALFTWLVYRQGLDSAALPGAVIGMPVAAAIFVRWRAGWWLAAFGTAQMLLGTIATAIMLATEPINFGTIVLAGMFASWTVMAIALLWWPETRRWCGLLPPTERDDD